MEVNWPFGSPELPALATTGTAPNVVLAAAQTVQVRDNLTVIRGAAPIGAAPTLNLTLAGELRVGALLILDLTGGAANRNLTLGTGFATTAAIEFVAAKRRTATFYFNGTAFVLLSTIQLD